MHNNPAVNIVYEEKQTEEIRDKLKRVYKDELYLVAEKYCGYGLNSNLNLEVDDLVYVIKKSDPLGNSNSWFIDNGSKSKHFLESIK